MVCATVGVEGLHWSAAGASTEVQRGLGPVRQALLARVCCIHVACKVRGWYAVLVACPSLVRLQKFPGA